MSSSKRTTPVGSKLDQLLRTLEGTQAGIDPDLLAAARGEYRQLQDTAAPLKGSSAKSSPDYSKLQSDYANIQTELKTKEAEIASLKHQLNLRQKKSQQGSSPHSNNTNVSETRTPAKVKERYAELYDTEWTDAFEYLKDNSWSEVDAIITLQRILRASQKFCEDVEAEQLLNIQGEALCPLSSWTDDTSIMHRMKTPMISKQVTILAKQYRRSTADECLPALQQAFVTHVLPTFVDIEKYNSKSLFYFSRGCVEVCWFMCMQEPPMVFVGKVEQNSPLDTKSFRCYSRPGDKVDYLVWPALLLNEGGHVVVKGVVQPVAGNTLTKINKAISGTSSPLRTPRPALNNNKDAARNPENWVNLDSDDEMDDEPTTEKALPRKYNTRYSGDTEVKPTTPYINPNSRTPPMVVAEGYSMDDETLNGSPNGSRRESIPMSARNLTKFWKKDEEDDY
ncbi:hypothetical protein CHS0354_003641 [Potamilus streckersoni]|uniref:Mitochondria-eating protein C-terminal domain-containing protein n=1 Tax=Potamilus streckersoni TaxID=2493646 RepID=A0AAE0S9H3_9BIVA|nr:hypothetical protein CHS0354_003641 [Potamilus streckersoni]